MNKNHLFLLAFAWLFVGGVNLPLMAQEKDTDEKTLRVFIFAGQSNMVGSDSKVKDIKKIPSFRRIGYASGEGFVLLQHWS